MSIFTLKSDFQPSGDQPDAIRQLIEGVRRGDRFQTLLGVTGSGKTFTISNVIASVDKPVLIMSHNKTLAAQLYGEFKGFFPRDRVEFFISYYDYYQPEAYVPTTDTYIAKDASINDEIDRLRLRATSALLSGDRNVIVVASVSSIYGIGAPEEWAKQIVVIRKGERLERNALLRRLLDIYYMRNDFEFVRGTMRVRQGLAALEASDPERARRVLERARRSVARITAEFPNDPVASVLAEDETAEDDEPCPALDLETGTCDLYSARPITCRVFGPPVRCGSEAVGVCELCFRGATDEEIAACEVEIDPENLEARLLQELEGGDTIVAFALTV